MSRSTQIVKGIQAEMEALGNPRDAQFLQRFFKTGPGQYGEGDRFRGIRVPVVREVAKRYRTITPSDVGILLKSPWHEDRLLALFMLNQLYAKGDEKRRGEIYTLYLANTSRINNWDLVDSSAEHVVGAHLWQRSRAPLRRLVRSGMLWERRIAVLATFHFIRKGEFTETLDLAARLLEDEEDLMHKAVGWMLRETGKRDIEALQGFLRSHCNRMPRTMLRYAIEKFPETERKAWLRGEG